MTRGSFEAWMKRLVCLWGVWCRLKEFPAAWKFPFRAERENAPSGSWYERRAHRNGNTVAQDCGRGRLGQPSDFGDGDGDGVWGVCVPTVGGSLSPTDPTHPSQRLSCAPCGVAPSTAGTEQEGWCSLAGHVRGACSLRAVLGRCVCLSVWVGFGILNRQTCMLLSSGRGLDEHDP